MFKRLVSLLIALALSAACVVSVVSCGKEDVESAIANNTETTGQEETKTSEDEKEDSFMTLPEYLASVKDVSVVKVLGVDETYKQIKQTVPMLAQMNITVEVVANLAISYASQGEVSSVEDLLGKVEENYPFEKFVEDIGGAEAKVEELLGKLGEYEGYSEVFEALFADEDFIKVYEQILAELQTALEGFDREELAAAFEELGYEYTDAESFVAFVKSLLEDEEFRGTVAALLESVEPFDTLISTLNLAFDDVKSVISALSEFEGYYDMAKKLLPLDTLLVTEDLCNQIVSVMDILEQITVEQAGDMLSMLFAGGATYEDDELIVEEE